MTNIECFLSLWGKPQNPQSYDSKRGTTREMEGKGKGEVEVAVRKSNRGGEFDQSSLYARMEMSQ
jgi:hypothetical protein